MAEESCIPQYVDKLRILVVGIFHGCSTFVHLQAKFPIVGCCCLFLNIIIDIDFMTLNILKLEFFLFIFLECSINLRASLHLNLYRVTELCT